MRRHTPALVCVVLLLGGSAVRADEPEAPSWAEVRASMKRAAKEVGGGARELGRTTGKEARRAGRGVDEATRESRREASDGGRGVWAEFRRGLVNAFDEVADELREQREDVE